MPDKDSILGMLLQAMSQNREPDKAELTAEVIADIEERFLPPQFCTKTKVEKLEDGEYRIFTKLTVPGLNQALKWRLSTEIDEDGDAEGWTLSVMWDGDYIVALRCCHINCMLATPKQRLALIESVRAYAEAIEAIEDLETKEKESD